MRGMLLLLLAACLLLPMAQALEPAQVVVVYNEQSELSRSTAQRYAQLRHIPQENLVGLPELKGGHISRLDFEQKIRMPLLMVGQRRGWRWPSGYTRGSTKRILAMVLMPDLPLGILGTPRPKGSPKLPPMRGDHAAVDSELMLLGANNAPLDSLLKNPAFEQEITLGKQFPPVLAVCRIDGPSPACIQRMLEDPHQVEKRGLWGWTVVDQGGKHKEGDEWLATVAARAQAAGHPLFHETSRSTLAEAFPLMENTALYFGWYAHPANGPFRPAAGGGFRFAPGAVAVHIHSASATSLRNPNNWVGALLTRGAAVTAGNVFEPYLSPTLHLDVFHDRLLKGYCVAEAALMASPVLSWQSIVLGDPLYRPFAANARGASANNVYAEWGSLWRQTGGNQRALEQAVRAREGQPWGAPLAEMFAWFCTGQKQLKEAAEYFARAGQYYTQPRDRMRAAIMEASVVAAGGERERAVELLRPWVEGAPNSPYLPALRASLEAISGEKKKR